jgi:hypothetical protein
MSKYELKVGDDVLTPNGKCDGVIVAIKGDKALVCENYFAATMIQDFDAPLSYIRDTFRCKAFKLTELVLDDDDDWDEDDAS